MKAIRVFSAAAVLSLLVACGGSSSTAPSPPPPAGGPTITITTSGVSPKNLTVSRGGQVTFANNDSVRHFMASDPHPEHTDCTELNQVGVLNPGQSRQTGNLNTPRTCGYHDHDNFSNNNLKGTITIQ